MGICCGISTKWLLIHCFQIELEFRSIFLAFWSYLLINIYTKKFNPRVIKSECEELHKYVS